MTPGDEVTIKLRNKPVRGRVLSEIRWHDLIFYRVYVGGGGIVDVYPSQLVR